MCLTLAHFCLQFVTSDSNSCSEYGSVKISINPFKVLASDCNPLLSCDQLSYPLILAIFIIKTFLSVGVINVLCSSRLFID